MPLRQSSTNTWIETDRAAVADENTPTTPTTPRDHDLNLLGYDEVAAILRISSRTLRRLVDQAAFPRPFMIGRAPRWKRDRVLEYLADAQTKAEKRR